MLHSHPTNNYKPPSYSSFSAWGWKAVATTSCSYTMHFDRTRLWLSDFSSWFWQTFGLEVFFPGRQLQAHPSKQVWVLGTFSLGHRLRLERGFRKHNVLRTAFKRLTLVTTFAADWQTFLDTRNSTFCLHGDVCLGRSKYNRTNKASIQTRELDHLPPRPSHCR